jgi:AcrR family transcriptional regulator
MARPPRTRRTRDETRQLLLDAAIRVVLARSNGEVGSSTNPLAGVRITDALEEVNRYLRNADPSTPRMTTGAVYNIWPNQEDFQLALLDRILIGAAVPGIDEVETVLDAGIAAGLPWQELVVRCFGTDFEISFAEPTMFVMIGVAALAPSARLAEINAGPNSEYVAATGAILQRILAHGKRRMVKGRTLEDLVWAIEALEAGYLLRRRSAPDITDRAVKGRTVVQAAVLALVEQFTDDIPPRRSRRVE